MKQVRFYSPVVVREAHEETGLQVKIAQLAGSYSFVYPAHLFPKNKPRAIFLIAFCCRVAGDSLTLNDEVTEFGWFPLDTLPDEENLLPYHKKRIQDAFAVWHGTKITEER